MGLSTEELDLLETVNVSSRGLRQGEIVEIEVHACAYSCCAKGWRRRDGYPQIYRGYIDNFERASHDGQRTTFMLYAQGIGTLSYVVAVRDDEADSVIEAAKAWPPAAPGRSRW